MLKSTMIKTLTKRNSTVQIGLLFQLINHREKKGMEEIPVD